MDAGENKTMGINPAEMEKRAKAIRDSVQARSVTAEQVGGLFLDIVKASCNPIAGRYWNELNSTPIAAGYYGDLQALRDLPKKLGLGRYLVTDDRKRRKLHPQDSTRFEDGSPAALDGSMGQCMWCWNAHYFTTWKEGNNTVMAVSFAPIDGKDSIYIPEGGISWMDVGVIDRETGMLCSVISESERYRGGGGSALTEGVGVLPQYSMLGMPATGVTRELASEYARKRGDGWEANWYVARAVIEYLFEIIMGTRNSQDPFSPELDENGLYHGGFGMGASDFPNWEEYNGLYPLIPTHAGAAAGDGVTVSDYGVLYTDGSLIKILKIPVFFGLVGAGYGNLGRMVSGLTIVAESRSSEVFIAPSLYAGANTTVDKMSRVAVLAQSSGWIRTKSYKGLCCVPQSFGGTATTYYSDMYTCITDNDGEYMRVAGLNLFELGSIGISSSMIITGQEVAPFFTAPLCYFAEDPKIQL